MLTISLLEREKYVLRKDTHSGKYKNNNKKTQLFSQFPKIAVSQNTFIFYKLKLSKNI